MEECDAIGEKTNQPVASPSPQQQPLDDTSLNDFLKKIVDDLVPSQDSTCRQGVPDDAEPSEKPTPNSESASRPWSPRSTKRYHASLAPIVEGKTAATRPPEDVAASAYVVDPAPSCLGLQLAETTPSMIAMTSRTSVDSLASDQSASMQTIFKTPDWADDDSDSKLSERADLSAPSQKQGTIVNAEEASSAGNQNAEQCLASVLTVELQEGSETVGQSACDRVPASTGVDSPGDEGFRSQVRDLAYPDLSDFDPLNVAALPVSKSEGEVDSNGCSSDCLTDGRCGSSVQTPLALMQLTISQSPELQQAKNSPQSSDDLIQFDILPANVSVVQDSCQSTNDATQVHSEVETSDNMPTTLRSPPKTTDDDQKLLVEEKSDRPAESCVERTQNQLLKHAGLAEFQKSLNQLKEQRDLGRVGFVTANSKEGETVVQHPRSTIDELEAVIMNVLGARPETRPPSLPRPDLKKDGVEESAADGTYDAKPVVQSERLPITNEPDKEMQIAETVRQERFDLISFEETEKVAKEDRTSVDTSDRSAVQISAILSPPLQSISKETDSENTSQVDRDCTDNSKQTASRPAQAHRDEVEIELNKTSSEIHQIKLSSSELLQDFYDMRKTYAAEFSLGSQCVTRTVAERDRTSDSHHRLLDSDSGIQSHRIESAIDLMDATIDEIQKWQTRKSRTLPAQQVEPVAAEVTATRKAIETKKAAVVASSSTVPTTPAPSRGRPPNKSPYGTGLRRDVRPARVDTSRPMTSHVPRRVQDTGGRATAPPRRDVLAGQEKRPSGDAKSPFIAASGRGQLAYPSGNIAANKLERKPSARLGKSPTAKSARTLQPRTPAEQLNELKKCTMSPATYLERCLSLAPIDAGRTKQVAPEKDNAKRAGAAQHAALKKTQVKEAVTAAPAKDVNLQKVLKPKEVLIPQKPLEGCKKDTNIPRLANNVPAAKNSDQPRNRFLSDDDIEKWVRLSTRYARCADLGASMFTSKHSCEGDKEAVKSADSLVPTASDVLIDTLMDTVTSAVKKTSNSKRPTSQRPTVVATKDILNKLSVGDTRCITQLKTEQKVTRSIDNLVRSMSKIVDSTSDKRVCWDSSLDSVPSKRDAGLDDVQEDIVEKSRQVVEKMTDTLIKHLAKQPDELDFKVADDMEPPTQLSAQAPQRWSDTKSTQLEVILSRLVQTNSSSSSWGLDVDAVPDSVRTSRHKLATLENIVALLNGIDRTCKNRGNNVEWDEPVEGLGPPSMAPLPEKGKHVQKGRSRRGVDSLGKLSSRQSSKAVLKKGGRLSYSNTDVKPKRPPTSAKIAVGSRHSKASKDADKNRKRSPSTKTLGSASSRTSRCAACVEKQKRAATTERAARRRRRSLSNALTPASSDQQASSVGSQSKDRLSYCDTCDRRLKKEKRAEERGVVIAGRPRHSASVTSARRERSRSPPMRRGSSLSSGSTNIESGSSKSRRFSYCDTCDEKHRKEALMKERGEKTPAKRHVINASTRNRSRSPLWQPGSSMSSASSLEDNASKKPRYSYCDTCDEKLRNQTPPATPLKNRSVATINSWRSESSQDIGHIVSTPRVSFSAPLAFFERSRESPMSPQKERARSPGHSASVPKHESRSQPTLALPTPPVSDLDLRQTDSMWSNLSASLSRDSTSDNYSSATFIIADRPSRPRVDLALPKIRHVEGTRSTYKHVLQKAFMDRLDNIIKVQSTTSQANLSAKPSATSATSMARYTLKTPDLSSADKYNMRHHIPTATEIRARMKRCCERMPSRDIFGVAISRESLASKSRQRIAESEQSFGFLDEVLDLEDFVNSSVSPTARKRALSATYTGVIQRDRPFLTSTKISREIQSFIKRDLSSWDKLTNDCIQSVRKDENILPVAMVPVGNNALRSASSLFNQSEQDLLLALITALGGSPRTRPSLLATREPANVAKETVKAMRKNKKYRPRDNLEQDEVVIPIEDFCSSETLLKAVNVVLKTDTEASVSASESCSTELESRSSSTDYETGRVASDFNVEQVLKSVSVLSCPSSVRNTAIDSTGSSTDCETQGQQQNVLENVAQFCYSPRGKYSDTSTAVSSCDLEEVETRESNEIDLTLENSETSAEFQDAEIGGTSPGDHEVVNTTKCCGASSEGDMPSKENTAVEPEDSKTEKAAGYELAITADSNLTMPLKSSSSLLDHLFSSATEASCEYFENTTDCGVKEVKEDRSSPMTGDLMNSSKIDSNESCCSTPEMLERLEMAIPFQHDRLAIETNSGLSMPIVGAVTEDTWDKLTHAISHLPQEAINTGDEIYSRHHHPNLPLDIRADLLLYNQYQADESLHQTPKTGNRNRNPRDSVCGIRQTKSLLSDNVHEPKVSEELLYWSEDTDAILAASGDTETSDFCPSSDGVSLIANLSTEVCVTDSVADYQSLLNVSSSSMMLAPSSAESTSSESSVSTPEVSAENEILVSLLDQVNTRSQLAVLNSHLDGVVRREQLVEEVVEQRGIEWRGASTISALCVTFGAVLAGAVVGLPSLWE